MAYDGVTHIGVRELTIDTYNVGESQNHYPEWKHLCTKEYLRCDSVYLKSWQIHHNFSQWEISQLLPEAERRGRHGLQGDVRLFRKRPGFYASQLGWWLHGYIHLSNVASCTLHVGAGYYMKSYHSEVNLNMGRLSICLE